MSLGKLGKSSVVDCMSLMPGGTRARLILINFDDISDYDENEEGVITAIYLKNNRQAYEFTGFRDDTQMSEEVSKPTVGVPVFSHKVGLTIYEIHQLQKNNIEQLSRGSFVGIIENRGMDDFSYEVLGIKTGLTIVAGPIRDAYEDGGFFTLSLATAEDEHEPKLPQTFGIDYDQATQDILDLLRPHGLADNIILENGDNILQEGSAGDFILIE
jgi:hypothetical protein